MRFLFAVLVLCVAIPAFAGTAVLTWTDNSTNESNFDVERKSSLCPGAAAWGALGTVGTNVVTFRDSTVTEGAAFCYRVKARNASGSSAWSNEVGLTVPLALPAAPTQAGVTYEP